jgi:uncharacterized protein
MASLRVLAIYVASVFLGGALLAPPLYWLAQAWGGSFPNLVEHPFHRYVNRALLGLALIGLWPLMRTMGAQRPRDLGLVAPAGQWRNLGAGFAIGFASLAVVALLVLLSGAREINTSVPASRVAEKMFAAALTAIVVALIEETLFRGAIFGALRRTMHWVAALLLSSMIYAIVHFMESARFEGKVTWLSGFELLPKMLAGFADWPQLVPGFFNLTLAGVLLGFAYQRTGNLYCSIGLHAGWIFWLKLYGVLTREIPGANASLWGTGRMINGWLALLVLGLALTVWIRRDAGRLKERV